MVPISTGLHVSTVSAGGSHRVCAIWRVHGRAASPPDTSCVYPAALLLPRRGAEQDWAVETVLAALRERGAPDGPACAALTTDADGIGLVRLSSGPCDADLLELGRAALGRGQREWAALAARDPAAFHAAADAPYVLRRQAALVRGPRPGRRPVHMVHRRSEAVLRAFTADLLSGAPGPWPPDPPLPEDSEDIHP
ncbi:hypothetical protein BJP40_26420 [Streptomyces sp. CC53]|uniref:hypothetical protein n=1 Tax=Streptomyces sp. CC53 TaxID=1906740 RepID=UPI0008DD7252|nr:hypothetical protein [Streptomyces sp. CC53]OII62933.1 hypothetical protein BJP40_26420 [Streptomyces sp. CC53]